MTPIDYAALAERLEAHAECHANVEPFDDEQRQWADDLRTVVTMLRGMADAAPIYAYEWDTYNGGVHRSFSSAPWNGHGPDRVLVLYTHPAPQPEPIDPHMIAAEDRFPDEPTEAQIEVARPYGTDTMSEMGIVPMCDEPERQPASDRCKHGVRFPHECKACADEPSKEDIQRWLEAELQSAGEPTEAQIEAAADVIRPHLHGDADPPSFIAMDALRAALAAKERQE